MTVRELLELLKAHDPDLLVVGRGYEEGYDDVGVHLNTIVDLQGPGEKGEWWTGRYEAAEYHADSPPIEAVVIA